MSTSKSPGFRAGLFVFRHYSTDMNDLKVDKAVFDAVLAKLLATPPMPKATISPKWALRPKKAAPREGPKSARP
jgi:hypothetical protein